jgi:hypothetical protein
MFETLKNATELRIQELDTKLTQLIFENKVEQKTNSDFIEKDLDETLRRQI